MSKPDVVFVNRLSVHGFLNGVINLTFTTARWVARPEMPHPDAPLVVQTDEFESAFLRMDLKCATDLRDALTKYIDEQTTKKASMQ